MKLLRFIFVLIPILLMNFGTKAMLPFPKSYDVIVDSIYYYLDKKNHTATVSSDVNNYTDNCYSGDLVIPDSFVYDQVVYRVDSICVAAFRPRYTGEDFKLTSVSVPDGVRTIVSNLFSECVLLESVKLGKGIKCIEANAFDGCSSLKEVNIPEGVTRIGQGAFQNCTALTAIELPESLDSIEQSVFQGCSQLASVTLGKHLKSIQGLAFVGCSALKEIIFPNSLQEIESSAFRDCKSLVEITIPDSVSKIDYNVFGGCSSLRSVVLPSGLKVIDSDAFWRCESLKDINIPDGIQTIYYSTFYGCSSLEEIFIPKSVKQIYREAFYDCSSLRNVHFEDGYDTVFLERDIFYNCPIRSLYLGRNLASDVLLFNEKKSLEMVSIGQYVTYLQDRMFEGCSHIAKVRCKAAIPPQLGYKTFANYNGYLYVPEENMKRYQKTNLWNRFNILPDTSDQEIGGIYYVIDEVNQQAYVTNGERLYEGNVVIPDSVLYQGTELTVSRIVVGAFEGCKGLCSVFIPKSVAYIGGNVFAGCDSLKTVSFENGSLILQMDGNFSDCPLKEVYLGRDLEYSSSPFASIESISLLTIGQNVTSVGQNLFRGCSGLSAVEIPDAVTTVGERAFYNCSQLNDIVLGKQLMKIGDEAFNSCNSLEKITSFAAVPPVIRQNVFDHSTYTRAQLIVPVGAKSVYNDADNWINFVNVSELGDTIIVNYSVTVHSASGGHVALGGQVIHNETVQFSAKEGEVMNLSVVPEEGYRIQSVEVNGQDVTGDVKDGSYSLVVNENVSIDVTFEKVNLFLTIQQADNGCVKMGVDLGKSYRFAIEVAEGWRINSVSFNGDDVTAELDSVNCYVTPMITDNSILNVSFELEEPSAVESVSTDRVVVRGRNGDIWVDGVVAGECVKVYTLGGALVADGVTTGYRMRIAVPQGAVYVVCVAGRTFKLRV